MQDVINISNQYTHLRVGDINLILGLTGEVIHAFAPIYLKEDFLGDRTQAELIASSPFNVAVGSSADPPSVIVTAAQKGGVARLTAANDSGTFSADSAMLNMSLAFRADAGGIFVAGRLKSNTAITARTLGLGFTDVLSATGATEEPSSISVVTLTTNASDHAGFLFDTSATAQEWHAVAVDTDVDTAFTALGVAPVADTYQNFLLVIDVDGQGWWYINGVLENNVAAVLTPTVLLTPYAYINSTTTTAAIADLDYIAVGGGR